MIHCVRLAALALACATPFTVAGQTPSFIYLRGAAESASSMYAAYSLGPAAAVFGMVVNPRTGYHDSIAGGGARLAHPHDATSIALTAADASAPSDLQLSPV